MPRPASNEVFHELSDFISRQRTYDSFSTLRLETGQAATGPKFADLIKRQVQII